jgi:hypothetical protein
MSEKLELGGTVNQKMTIKVGDGILAKGTPVKVSGNNEVRKCNAVGDKVFGFIYVPNHVDGGEATICTRFKRIATCTTGAAYAAGDFVNVDAAAKIIKAAASVATGSVTIVDYSILDNGDKITLNGVDVISGTDFTPATSNANTATLLAAAINLKVPGVKAIATAGVVNIQAVSSGSTGNSIVLTTNADVGEMTVSAGGTLTGGGDFWPLGMALEASGGVDQSKLVGWF